MNTLSDLVAKSHKLTYKKYAWVELMQLICSHETTEVHIDEVDNVKTTTLVCSNCGKVIEENYKPKTTCKEI